MAKRNNNPGRPPRKGRNKTPRETSRLDSSAWLYGKHAVLAALANPARRPRRLLLTADCRDGLSEELDAARRAGGHDAPTLTVLDKRELSDLLPPGAVHQGLALDTAPLETVHLEDVLRQTEPLADATLVILDQATDPHNIGAILRSAAAFGAAAVIMQDRHAPEASGAMAKAASGALEHVAMVRAANLARAMEQAKAAGFWCIGLDGRATQTLAEADLGGKVALVLGAEGGGLRRLTRETCDLLVKVPIGGAVESLNLSNAAAIALYERARGASKPLA